MKISSRLACVFLPLLLGCSPSSSAKDLQCTYMAKASESNPYPELEAQGDCGTISGDVLTVHENHLGRLSFDARGLGYVFAGDGVFYVNRKGDAVRTVVVDSAPDDFREGVARGVRDGRVGFVEESLGFVIDPVFDFAFPFEGSYALVCNGCRERSVGEHSLVEGGDWGVIGRDGTIAIPVKYPRKELEGSEAFRELGL